MQECGEHNTNDLATDDPAVDKQWPVNRRALFCVSVKWGRVDCGALLPVAVGCMNQVYIVYLGFLKCFCVFIFVDLNTNL